MISKLSTFFTKKLVKNGTIHESEQEIYVYGFFMLLSKEIRCTFILSIMSFIVKSH